MILIVPCKVLCSIVLLSLLTAVAGHDNTASKHRSPWLCFLSALIGDGDGGGRCYFVMPALSLYCFISPLLWPRSVRWKVEIRAGYVGLHSPGHLIGQGRDKLGNSLHSDPPLWIHHHYTRHWGSLGDRWVGGWSLEPSVTRTCTQGRTHCCWGRPSRRWWR